MKKRVLLALGLCYALTSPLFAQIISAEDEYKDTLILEPGPSIKILLIGGNMESMLKYARADTLKTLFLADIQNARKQSTFPSESRLTHYIVHPNGRRRLKAESEDYQEQAINLSKEILAMTLNLPPYAYIIYDVSAECEIQIYLSSPSDLVMLETVNLSEAIKSVAAAKRSERRFSTIEIKKENEQWTRVSASNKKRSSLELHTSMGLGIIGSQFAPEAGFVLSYVFSKRHGIPQFKINGSVQYSIFADYTNKEFKNIYEVGSYNINVMGYEGNASSIRWVGVEFGSMHADGGSLDRNYKVGILYEFKSIQVGFNLYTRHLIYDKSRGNKLLYGFVVRSIF